MGRDSVTLGRGFEAYPATWCSDRYRKDGAGTPVGGRRTVRGRIG
jgi:hypothetical protein